MLRTTKKIMRKIKGRLFQEEIKKLEVMNNMLEELTNKSIGQHHEIMINMLNELKDTIKYQHYEISDIKSKLRHIIPLHLNDIIFSRQTHDSFDYQWDRLNHGLNLLSDDNFKNTVVETICKYTQLSKEWFEEKTVLDAGCGQGRFAYGFCKLGANVVACDQAHSAIEQVEQNCCEYSTQLKTFKCNILQPLDFIQQVDLVWSYGVIHHTGNTFQAFKNLVNKVKSGGFLFLMVYGEPAVDDLISIREQAEYSRMRELCKNRSYEEKIAIIQNEKPIEHLHGWFDAVSPDINDTYRFSEIESWLLTAGFVDIKRTFDNANHHIIAKKI